MSGPPKGRDGEQPPQLNCPLCDGVVRTAQQEYHIREVADDGDEYFWACDECHYTASRQVEWVSRRPKPPMPSKSDGHRLRADLEQFVTDWGGKSLDAAATQLWKQLRHRLKFRRMTETRIRKTVGNSGRRPRPDSERRFVETGKEAGVTESSQ